MRGSLNEVSFIAGRGVTKFGPITSSNFGACLYTYKLSVERYVAVFRLPLGAGEEARARSKVEKSNQSSFSAATF